MNKDFTLPVTADELLPGFILFPHDERRSPGKLVKLYLYEYLGQDE